MKHWIPKNLKKGRCTPMPNPDCKPGTPQYNLAKTFKKYHGFHADGGGSIKNPFITSYNPKEENNIFDIYGNPYNTSYDIGVMKPQIPTTDIQTTVANPKNPILKGLNKADAILEDINKVGDVATGLLESIAKPDSKGMAYAEGSQMAQNVVKPLEKIPVIGQASKLISGIIGGALSARKQGIKNKEEDKQFKLTEYLNRNLMDLPQPSYYGQYMAKYGSNPKTLEQRVLDDIYSDFDKYMKLT